MENKKKIYNLVIMALMIALCYVGTFIMIPLPTGDKIHLGNLVCLLASLLLGGIKGGLAGSIGMGLNDLHFYLDTPSTIIRTLILKFLMGLICGIIFTFFKKKNIKGSLVLGLQIVLGILFLAIFSWTLYLSINNISYDDKTSVSLVVPICTLIFGLIFLSSIFFLKDKHILYKYVLISVSVALMVNILGEFFTRIILGIYLDNYGFMPSLMMSFAKLPASIFTSIITIILATLSYLPLSKALKTII